MTKRKGDILLGESFGSPVPNREEKDRGSQV
jgi:hypothetical protein